MTGIDSRPLRVCVSSVLLLALAGAATDDTLVVRGESKSVDIPKGSTWREIRFDPSNATACTVSGAIELLTGGKLVYPKNGTVLNQTLASAIHLRGSATFRNDNDWTHMAHMLRFTGPLTGDADLTIEGDGDGAVSLEADNSTTFKGPIRIPSGRLLVQRDGALGAASAPITLLGGKLALFGGTHAKSLLVEKDSMLEIGPSATLVGDVTLANGATGTIDTGGGNTGQLVGSIHGKGSLRFRGGGRNRDLQLSPFTLAGDKPNDFSGGVTIEKGTLRLAKPPGVTAASGTLRLSATGTELVAIELGASDQIADDARIEVTRGPNSLLRLQGHSESIGELFVKPAASLSVEFGDGPETLRIAHFQPGLSRHDAWDWDFFAANFDPRNDHLNLGASVYAAAMNHRQGVEAIRFLDPVGMPPGLYACEARANGEILVGEKIAPRAPVAPPFPLDAAATAARAALYERHGIDRLSALDGKLPPKATLSFFGDSITWLNGYVAKLGDELKKHGDLAVRNRGINGCGVRDLRDGAPGGAHAGGQPGDGVESNGPQAAFDTILDQDKPALVCVLIGINDINWKGTTDADYEKGLRDLVAACKKHDSRVVLATPLLDGEMPDGSNHVDAQIESYARIVERVARESGATFVDLRAAVIAWLRNHNRKQLASGELAFEKQGLLTYDGIHLSDTGNALVADLLADGIVRAVAGDAGALTPPEAAPPAKPANPPKPANNDPPPLQARVNLAIDRGVEALMKWQELDGSWADSVGAFPSGMTGLALYTLEKSGVKKDHPSIQRGVAYLLAQPPPERTYSASTSVLALCAIDPVKYHDRIAALVERLISWQRLGGYAYPDGAQDLSNTQYAAMALRAASIAGFKIPQKVWDGLIKWTLDRQENVKGAYEGAGYRYNEGHDATGSMTAAGLSVLLIGMDRSGKKPNAAVVAKNKGIDWIAENFSVEKNPHPRFHPGPNGGGDPEAGHLHYFLYGLERVGALEGISKFGDHDWYREGAEWLLKHQDGNGSWENNQPNTCFALLFLARATAPVTGGDAPEGRVLGKEDKNDDVWLRAKGDTPLALYITGFGDRVKREFIEGDDESVGPRVARVEYVAFTRTGEKSLFVREVDKTKPCGEERFVTQVSLERPGPIEVEARVRVVRPGSDEIVELRSPRVKVWIFGVFDSTLLSYASSASTDLIFPPTATATASSEENPGWAAGNVCDRQQALGWRASPNDKDPNGPWIRVTLKVPVRASKIALSPTVEQFAFPEEMPKIRKVGIRINQGAEFFADIVQDPQRKTVVDLPSVMKVQRIDVRIVETDKSANGHGIGFDEIELFP